MNFYPANPSSSIFPSFFPPYTQHKKAEPPPRTAPPVLLKNVLLLRLLQRTCDLVRT